MNPAAITRIILGGAARVGFPNVARMAAKAVGGGSIGCILTGYCSTTDDPAHPEEEDILNATCDDISWAIPELEAIIAKRKRQYKDSGGGNFNKNPSGPGHKKRIEILEDKLRSLKDCPQNCPL